MTRLMAEDAYKADQWARRFEPHVKPLKDFVDELGTHDEAGHPPYIAPFYRGIRARVLAVLRDPGSKAGGVKGSGFLSVENDDPTAERQVRFITEAGLDPAEVVPWNAYPWYINKKLNAAQLRVGSEPLRRVIELLPELRVILLLGGTAQQTCGYFTKAHTGLVEERGITVVQTYHPSRQALQHPDAALREDREEDLRHSFRTAGTIVLGGVGATHDQPRTSVTLSADLAAMQAGRMRRGGRPRCAPRSSTRGLPPRSGCRSSSTSGWARASAGNQPDLDNLINSTIDALDDLLGPRPGTCGHDEIWSVSQ